VSNKARLGPGEHNLHKRGSLVCVGVIYALKNVIISVNYGKLSFKKLPPTDEPRKVNQRFIILGRVQFSVLHHCFAPF
jgi:hypothetical protein